MIIALLIGTIECQNIKENKLIGGAEGGFGGSSDVKKELRAAKYGGSCGDVGEYGGCSDLNSKGDSKRKESQP